MRQNTTFFKERPVYRREIQEMTYLFFEVYYKRFGPKLLNISV